MDQSADNTGRFTGRADAYVKYRSSYPPEAITLLAEYFNLPAEAKIADVGSGTGILSAVVLETLRNRHVKVIGVEPNKDMRDAGETFMKASIEQGAFESVNGTAEKTTLPDHSIDIVMAGAAFQWFDTLGCRAECLRTIKPSSSLADNECHGAPFAFLTRHHRPDSALRSSKAKEMANEFRAIIVRHGADHTVRVHQQKTNPETLKTFFGHDQYKVEVYERTQRMTLEQVIGRMKSMSSVPPEGSAGWEPLINDVKAGYERFKDEDGMVEVLNDGKLIYGYIR